MGRAPDGAPHVFLSYVHEDRETVARLVAELEALGFAVWLDRAQLGPGDRWKDEIRSAISQGAAFLACFSAAFGAKGRSYMREELALAVEELRLRPREQTWFVPVRLDSEPVPPLPISGHETLHDLQHVALFEEWESGIRRLACALRPVDAIVDDLLAGAGDVDARSALPLLDRAVGLAPRRRDARRARALTRIACGLLAEATDDYEEASPEYPAERAWSYWLAGDTDSAIAGYKRLAQRGGASARDCYDLGCLLYDAGRAEEALVAFETAVSGAPDALAPRRAVLRLLLRGPEQKRTAAFADETEKRCGPHADIYEARGLAMVFGSKILSPILMTKQDLAGYDHTQVVAQLERAQELDPSNARRLYRAGMILFHLRDYKNARKAVDKGLKLVPESASLLTVLAQLYEYGSDDKDEGLNLAAPTYMRAGSAEPDHLDVEEEFPLFDGDVRTPRPPIQSYGTIPLSIAGVATSGPPPTYGRFIR